MGVFDPNRRPPTRNVVRRKPVTKTRDTFRPGGPVGVFAQPTVPTTKPFTKQRAQQRAKTQRAVRNLAPQPHPYIPVKKSYTAPERKAIVEIVHRNANRVASTIKDSGANKYRTFTLDGHEISGDRQLGFQREAARSQALLSQLRALPRSAQNAYLRHMADTVSPGLRRRMEALIRSTGGKPVLGPPTPTQNAQISQGTKRIIQSQVVHTPGRRDGGVPRWAMALVSPDTNLAVALAKGVAQSGSPYRNAASDIKNLAIAPVVGTYALGKASIPAVTKGDTTQLKQFAKGMGESLSQSAIVKLAQGDTRGALEAFGKHPVFSALDVAGVTSIVGRGAGALARGAGAVEGGALREGLARAGSVTRPPLDIGGPMFHEREYSRDLIRKGLQVVADKGRRQAVDVTGAPMFVKGPGGRKIPVLESHGTRAGSRVRHPLVGSEREQLQARRGTFIASRENATERLVRDQARADLKRIGKLPTRTRHALEEVISTVVTGTVRSGKTAVKDLTARRDYLRQLIHDFDENPTGGVFAHKGERDAAQHTVDAITTVLNSDKAKANIGRLVEAGYENARRLNRQDVAAKDLRLVNARSADRSKLFHWAQQHLGAKYHTAEDHAALEKNARAVENTARAELKAAQEAGDSSRIMAAKLAVRHAREQRIAVSGRHPEKVRAHEHARTAHARAHKAVQKAEADLRKAWNTRSRLVGAQSVQRGQRSAERMKAVAGQPTRARRVLAAIDAATKDEAQLAKNARGEATRAKRIAEANAAVKSARQRLKAAQKARREAAVELKQNPMPKANAGLRKADGTILTDQEIIRDIEKHRGPGGLDTIAYLPDRMDVRGARAYHTQFRLARPNLNRETRTGAAYEKGINDISIHNVADELAHKATQISKARQIDKAFAENAVRHPAVAKAAKGVPLTKLEQKAVDRGGHFTAREAERMREKLEADTGQRYTLVRAFNSKSMSGAAAAAMQSTKGMELFGQKLLNNRLEIDMSSSARNVMLVPTKIVEELNRNLMPADSFRRFLQYLNKPFRFAVLAQPRWLTGNFIEPYLVRLPMYGTGPLNLPGMFADVRASVRYMRHLKNSGDPAKVALYNELKAHHHGGLFIGERGLSNRRSAEEIAGIGHYAGVIKRLPVVHQLGWLAKHTLGAYFPFNRGIESLAQHTAFGNKLRREVQEFTGKYLEGVRMSQKAMEELDKRMVNTATQQRFAAFQDEVLGQYSRFPAWLREQIQGWAPFLPWFMASARFVFWTLPAKHPAKTAFLIHASDTIQKEWDNAHKPGVVPPGGLRLALPRSDGGFTDAARYTPFGFPGPVAEGDTATLMDPFFPQFQGAAKALEGKDPFGRDLQVPKGEKPNIPLITLNTILESLVPGLAQGRRLREHGETPYSNSTILSPKTKPGTSHGMSAVERTYNPFRPTYLRKGGSGGKLTEKDLEGLSPLERRLILREQAQSSSATPQLSPLEKRLIARGH